MGKAPGGPEGAYVLAGYKRDDKNAARLTKNDGVAKRRRELLEALAGTALVTVESLTLEAEEARLIAMADRNPAAAIAAINTKAKLHGLGVDARVKHEHTHNFDKMTPEELAFEWAAMLAEIRAANNLDENGQPLTRPQLPSPK